jgi:molybdopterin-guanine dinucleotide biosynthesis protein B
MKAVGFAGPSGVGKTTLITGVIRELKAAGQRVSVVKHAHQGFDIDHPGKDSRRHREAGAFELVIASKHRLAKLREFEAEVPVTVHQLLAELVECDWALVEGFKHADLLRIELWREGGAPPAYPDDPYVVAIAAPDPARLPVPTGRPVFALDDAAGVARYLLGDAGRFDYTAPP